MPAHAVISIPIKIEQAAIESSAATFVYQLQQRDEPFRPTLTAMNNSTVSI
jgi:hypothetical protein